MRPQDKKLLGLFRDLPAEQQDTLLAFAEFLAGRAAANKPVVSSRPLTIHRPAEEKVVQAIKRLRETYPMLDHGKMLHEVSHHMTQHVMQGKAAKDVIDELELVFRAHYEQMMGEGEQ
jgi:hypothetical protein